MPGKRERVPTRAVGEGVLIDQRANDDERDLRERDRQRAKNQRKAAAKGGRVKKQRGEDLRAKVNRLTAELRQRNPTLSRSEIARRIAPACGRTPDYIRHLVPRR